MTESAELAEASLWLVRDVTNSDVRAFEPMSGGTHGRHVLNLPFPNHAAARPPKRAEVRKLAMARVHIAL